MSLPRFLREREGTVLTVILVLWIAHWSIPDDAPDYRGPSAPAEDDPPLFTGPEALFWSGLIVGVVVAARQACVEDRRGGGGDEGGGEGEEAAPRRTDGAEWGEGPAVVHLPSISNEAGRRSPPPPRTGRVPRALRALGSLVVFLSLSIYSTSHPRFSDERVAARRNPTQNRNATYYDVSDPDVLLEALYSDAGYAEYTSHLSNVTLSITQRRGDRMGSRIQLPLGIWIFAHHHGWNFCSPPDDLARRLSFTMCDDDVGRLMLLASGNRTDYVAEGRVDRANGGTYLFNTGRNEGWYKIHAAERGDGRPMVDAYVRTRWGRMILGAAVSSARDGWLWRHEDSVRVAVHVRRGDIVSTKRNDVWISDDRTIACIELARWYVGKERPGSRVEVHLFSEQYGETNWPKYEPVVDAFHLAPGALSNDIDLNLRDWKHFVAADFLIVGGTFSKMPGLARGGPGADGFPVTVHQEKGMTVRGWSAWDSVDKPNMSVKLPCGRYYVSLPGGKGLPPNATLLGIDSAIEAEYMVVSG